MATPYGTVHYWLVDNPIISQYQWDPHITPGASPLFLALTICTYLTLTLLLHRFPSLLPTIPSPALRIAAATQSLLLCLLSVTMVVGCALSILHQTPPDNVTWCICFPVGATNRARGPTFFWAYVFYLSKILEFLDTLLILLSGSRSRRLSFLHVYHHAVVVAMCYSWMAGQQSLFPMGVLTNASVHVLMYAYYFLCALGYRPEWKRMVTDCQIMQFLFAYLCAGLLLYLHFTGPGCSGMRSFAFSAVFNTSLLLLFLNFHINNYRHGRNSGDKQL